MPIGKHYLDELARRRKESRVYRKHQLVGLEIAEILKDDVHRSLYIKLAKEGNPMRLLRVAKEIAENQNVHKKGAYFMWMIHHDNKLIPPVVPKTLSKKKVRKNLKTS